VKPVSPIGNFQVPEVIEVQVGDCSIRLPAKVTLPGSSV